MLRFLSTLHVAISSSPPPVPISVYANNVKRERATPPRATDLKLYTNHRLAGSLEHGKQFRRFDDNMLVWHAHEAPATGLDKGDVRYALAKASRGNISLFPDSPIGSKLLELIDREVRVNGNWEGRKPGSGRFFATNVRVLAEGCSRNGR